MKRSAFLFCLIAALSLFLFSCGKQPEPQIPTGDGIEESYTVSFDSDGGTDVDSQDVEPGERAVKPDDPEKEGYEFQGWYYKNKKFDFKTEIDSDITLKAKWKAIEYEVRFSTDGGSRVDPVKVLFGDSIEPPEDPTK